MLRKHDSVVDSGCISNVIGGYDMITLQEDLFRDLVLRSQDYILIGQETKDAIDNSDYGEEWMIVENDPDTVGWAGPAIGHVPSTEKGEEPLYRLWRRSTWKRVGNLARERAAERDRKCAEADARKEAAKKEYDDRLAKVKDDMLKAGIKPALVEKIITDMKPDEITKMLGL